MQHSVSLAGRIRDHLNQQLRTGAMPPGSAGSVKDVSELFSVSGTPVREALERLVGEGRIAATGSRHGFAIPRFGVRTLSGLYSFTAQLVEISLRQGRSLAEAKVRPTALMDGPPALATAGLIGAITDRSSNPIVIVEAARISAMLAPYRAVEPDVVIDWRSELIRLSTELGRPETATKAIRSYTRIRTELAAEIMDAAEHPEAR